MNIKSMIKKIPGVEYTYKWVKFKLEYIYDFKFFYKNYSHSKLNKSKIGYNILLIAHSIEKGLINEELRPFGVEKVKELILLLEKYDKLYNDTDAYDFIVGVNSLREYAKVYETQKWTKRNEYKLVKDFINRYNSVEIVDFGKLLVDKKELSKDYKIDYGNFLKSRHSLRSFDNKELSDKDVIKAIDMAILSPSACNRQMCKIYQVKNKELVNFVVKNGQGFGGFNSNSINIFVVTFDVNANYFIGERNQGWFNAGLISMNFINALHSLGIGSCFVQFGNTTKEEELFKKKLNIPSNERIAVLIGCGYYKNSNVFTLSPRKNIKDIYKIVE